MIWTEICYFNKIDKFGKMLYKTVRLEKVRNIRQDERMTEIEYLDELKGIQSMFIYNKDIKTLKISE